MSDQFEKFLKENKPILKDDQTRALKANLFKHIDSKPKPSLLIPSALITSLFAVALLFTLNRPLLDNSEIDAYLQAQLDYDYLTEDIETDFYGESLLRSL